MQEVGSHLELLPVFTRIFNSAMPELQTQTRELPTVPGMRSTLEPGCVPKSRCLQGSIRRSGGL